MSGSSPLPVVLIILGAILLIFALPVLIPAIAFAAFVDKRRLHRDADRACCAVCGAPLGLAALELADRACMAEAGRRSAALDGLRRRIVRHLKAVCTVCGARYRYDRRVFSLIEPAPAPEPEPVQAG